jgi:hypothetical protein
MAAHRGAFDLHTAVAVALEGAVIRPRAHPTIIHIVLDMLMLQGLKSHATVSLLSQHGLMEDTATIARRLLELSVQAVYIGAESEQPEQLRRAGRYLAFLWRQLPGRMKHRLPSSLRAEWTGWARKYGRLVPARAKQWGPTFREIFREVGAEDLYLQDYSFLSAIAHGSSDAQVFQHSVRRVRLHSHDFAPIVLVYASRYYLALAEQWNRMFGLIDTSVFDPLLARATKWLLRKGAA